MLERFCNMSKNNIVVSLDTTGRTRIRKALLWSILFLKTDFDKGVCVTGKTARFLKRMNENIYLLIYSCWVQPLLPSLACLTHLLDSLKTSSVFRLVSCLKVILIATLV